jgi:hypothetical protein
VYTAKILVNIFGPYFDIIEEDTENIVPSAIPEVFPTETKNRKDKKDKYDFSDMNKKKEE